MEFRVWVKGGVNTRRATSISHLLRTGALHTLQHLSNFGKICSSLLPFNPHGIKERPRRYHKMLKNWKYLLHTKLPWCKEACTWTALGLTGSWIPGLLVKTLSMHWKTQMLCIWTLPFLLTLLKRPPNESSKHPYRHWTLNKQLNSRRSVTISFLPLYQSYLTETLRAPASSIDEMKRRVTLTTSVIISGSYINMLGREEELSSNKVLVMTNTILTWDPHNCLYKHTAKHEWLQMPGSRKKPPTFSHVFCISIRKEQHISAPNRAY